MSKNCFLPYIHTHTHTNMCMLICTDQLLPVPVTTHSTINGYTLNWKALCIAMSIKVCLEEQVRFSQKITGVGSRT